MNLKGLIEYEKASSAKKALVSFSVFKNMIFLKKQYT
jgi:hypothetical protein